MPRKKTILWIVMIILMIIVAAFILMIQSGKNCEITISGTIRFPALESGGED